jgi:hypothetical protein
MSLTSTEISHAKTQNDQRGNTDKLNNDIRCCIKHEKAKLSGLVTALTNEKENTLKKLDESVTLKLKGHQICSKLTLEKEKVALQRTIEAKLNVIKNQETTLQHTGDVCLQCGAENEVAQKDFEIKEKSGKKSFKNRGAGTRMYQM